AGRELSAWLDDQKKPHTACLRGAKIEALAIGDAEKKLLREQPASEAALKLAKRHAKALALADADYRRVFTGEQCRRWDALRRDLDAVGRSRPPSPPTA